MIRRITRALRQRPGGTGARALALAVLGALAIGSAVADTHDHDSQPESAQCVVCHWQDRVVESPGALELPEAPPVRIVEQSIDATPRAAAEVLFLPPATGPPARH